MSEYKAVIFDQDGVLVHLLPFFSAVDAAVSNVALQTMTGKNQTFATKDDLYYNPMVNGASFEAKLLEVSNQNGFEAISSHEKFRHYIELRDALVDVLLEGGADAVQSLEGGKDVIHALEEHGLLQNGQVKISTFPGVSETLADLQEKGAVIALASTNPPGRVQNILTAAGLWQFFKKENVFGADGTRVKAKPAPDVYLRAMAKLENCAMEDLTPERTARYLAVEDSVSGTLSAQAAGMHVVGIAQDPSKDFEAEKRNLLANGANVVFEQFLEVGNGLRAKLGWAVSAVPTPHADLQQG